MLKKYYGPYWISMRSPRASYIKLQRKKKPPQPNGNRCTADQTRNRMAARSPKTRVTWASQAQTALVRPCLSHLLLPPNIPDTSQVGPSSSTPPSTGEIPPDRTNPPPNAIATQKTTTHPERGRIP